MKKIAKTSAPVQEKTSALPAPSQEEVQHMIATATNYHAQQRSFAVGYEQEDWLLAENEISQKLASELNPS